jgi:ubiquinone/menaquinone biosynthesis C-methylase UbiE
MLTDMDDQNLPWTGERLVTSIFNFGAIDHLHRYALAMQLIEDKDILDIASGEGYGSFLLSKGSKSVIGVDISAEAVEHSTKKYKKSNLLFKTGAADSIPLPDGSIDVVVSFETIEHLDRHNEMIIEIKRVLRHDGILIISSPDKSNYSESPGITNPFHIKELYQKEFKALLRAHFDHTIFLNQKSIYGSLIVPETDLSLYKEFLGDYQSISMENGMQNPVYNICIASKNAIEFHIGSFFSGKKCSDYATPGEIEQLRNELWQIRNSRGYKFLSYIRTRITPIRAFFR